MLIANVLSPSNWTFCIWVLPLLLRSVPCDRDRTIDDVGENHGSRGGTHLYCMADEKVRSRCGDQVLLNGERTAGSEKTGDLFACRQI